MRPYELLRRMMQAQALAGGVVWNPAGSHAQVAISNGGRTAAYVAGTEGRAIARANAAAIAGKRYWELRVDALSGTYPYAMNVGVQYLLSTQRAADLGNSASQGAALIRDGRTYYAGALAAYMGSFVQGDVIGIAIDRAANRMWFSVNGVWGNGTADPAAGTGFASFALNGSLDYIPAVSVGAGSSLTANFAASDWVYPAPSGFTALTV